MWGAIPQVELVDAQPAEEDAEEARGDFAFLGARHARSLVCDPVDGEGLGAIGLEVDAFAGGRGRGFPPLGACEGVALAVVTGY